MASSEVSSEKQSTVPPPSPSSTEESTIVAPDPAVRDCSVVTASENEKEEAADPSKETSEAAQEAAAEEDSSRKSSIVSNAKSMAESAKSTKTDSTAGAELEKKSTSSSQSIVSNDSAVSAASTATTAKLELQDKPKDESADAEIEATSGSTVSIDSTKEDAMIDPPPPIIVDPPSPTSLPPPPSSPQADADDPFDDPASREPETKVAAEIVTNGSQDAAVTTDAATEVAEIVVDNVQDQKRLEAEATKQRFIDKARKPILTVLLGRELSAVLETLKINS